jgi:hypothetical protein
VRRPWGDLVAGQVGTHRGEGGTTTVPPSPATHSDAVTHSDALSYRASRAHACAYARKGSNEKCVTVRHCVTIRGAPPDHHTTIERLANAVTRLAPHHRDPERFHLDKHTIAAELHQLAAALRKERL